MSSRTISTRRRSGSVQASSFADTVELWLPRVMEILWLAAIALVPLVFAPKDFMVFIDVPKVAALRIITGLLAVLWAIEWAVKPRHAGIDGGVWTRFKAWLGAGVSHWIIAAATVFMIVNILSTLFAPVISVSIWGSNPGRDGYGLYNMVSLYILFAVIATHLKTGEQLWRMLRVIAGVSTVIAVYGVLQHFGVVPLYQSVVDRIQGTFGNALFAGSYFVLTIPLSAGAALAHSQKSRSVWVAAGWIGIIAAQMAAMLLTLSRGPWIALAIGLMVWLALVLIIAGRASFVKGAVMLGGAFAIALVISYLPSPDLGENFVDAGQVAGRASSIGSDLTTDGLNGRAAIWKRASYTLVNRPWFDPEQQTPSFVRHLFGYGPDMYLYATPIHWIQGLTRSVNASAHNYLLQIWVELGVLGLLAFALLVGVAVIGSGSRLVRNRNVIMPQYAIIFSALLAALAGRIIEQTTGVARISDMMLFWTILGLIAALLAMIRAENEGVSTVKESDSRSVGLNKSTVLRWSIAIFAITIVGVLIFQKNLNYMAAANLGAAAVETFRDRELIESLELMDKAIAAAPDVELYYKTRADMMNSFIAQSVSDEIEIAAKQYELNKRALDANPLSHTARDTLAAAALKLAQLGQDGKGAEAIALYRELTRMVAGEESIYLDLAIAHLTLGQPQQAIQALDDFVAVTNGQVKVSSKSNYYRGVAYQELGNAQEAMRWLKEYLSTADGGIEREYVPITHQRLADIYGELGQPDMQAKHLAAFERLSSK